MASKRPEKPDEMQRRAFALIRRCERMGAPITVYVLGKRLGYSRGVKCAVVNALRAAGMITIDVTVRPNVVRTIKKMEAA